MQELRSWIAEWTKDAIRDTLLFASIEEYCLRPIGNQPLIACRFVSYLQRHQKGGITQVPANVSIRLVSQVLARPENSISLLDTIMPTWELGKNDKNFYC